MARDDFTALAVRSLRMRAALICSNPNCRKQTVAPSASDPESFVCLGKAAHICAAAPGGPRYDANMSPEQRSGITNAIYLCGTCADLIDKNGGADYPPSVLLEWKEQHEQWVTANLNRGPDGVGGEGGSGTIIGNRGVAIGGRGGKGGVYGTGGKGGSGVVHGDDALVIGGNGGDAGSADGRGGAGARSPTERFGMPTMLWGFGRGGAGVNDPEYDRRLHLLRHFCEEYKARFPQDAWYIEAGIDAVPVDWINQRLVESNETWQVSRGDSGFALPPLTPTPTRS